MSDVVEFLYATKPFAHQKKLFEETRDLEYYAVLWEQGTGKTKPTLDTMQYLYRKGEIDCLLVVAPNGVHRNWVAEEIEKHLPADLLAETKAFIYHASKAKRKYAQKAAKEVLEHKGLSIITMSYDSFVTKGGKEFAGWVLNGNKKTKQKARRCLYVLDESARIKNPKAKRTKSIILTSKYAKYRRILTGTPVANGPFDVYSQMRFLLPTFWVPHGLANYTMFKNFFATFIQKENADGHTYPMLLQYENLKMLNGVLKEHSSRVLKDDVLDLPPKLYSKRFFELSPKQRKLYDTLKIEFIAELDEGEFVTADMALTRLLRLRQVACGYVTIEKHTPHEDDPDYMVVTKEVRDIEERNLRVECTLDTIIDLPHKAIIWSCYTRDIDMICEALGDNAVRYDGKCTVDQKAYAVDSFQHGMHNDAQFFVANPLAAGEGLTLTQAKTVLYHNNDFKLIVRLQSEDRAHRIGTVGAVYYIDICAINTIDDKVIQALRDKKHIADQITGDKMREWL